jgi:hypothetical protein
MRPSEKLTRLPKVRAVGGSACDRLGCVDLGRLVFREHVRSVARGRKEDGDRRHEGRGTLGEIGHSATSRGGLRANRVR